MNPSITNPLFAAKADLSDALITKDATVSRGPNDDPTYVFVIGTSLGLIILSLTQ